MKILFIEDNLEVIDLANIYFGKILTEHKKKVSIDYIKTLKNLKEHLLENNKYDLILLDNNLPDGEAFEFIEDIHRKYRCDIYLHSADLEASKYYNKEGAYNIIYPKTNNLYEVLCQYI